MFKSSGGKFIERQKILHITVRLITHFTHATFFFRAKLLIDLSTMEF